MSLILIYFLLVLVYAYVSYIKYKNDEQILIINGVKRWQGRMLYLAENLFIVFISLLAGVFLSPFNLSGLGGFIYIENFSYLYYGIDFILFMLLILVISTLITFLFLLWLIKENKRGEYLNYY